MNRISDNELIALLRDREGNILDAKTTYQAFKLKVADVEFFAESVPDGEKTNCYVTEKTMDLNGDPVTANVVVITIPANTFPHPDIMLMRSATRVANEHFEGGFQRVWNDYKPININMLLAGIRLK